MTLRSVLLLSILCLGIPALAEGAGQTNSFAPSSPPPELPAASHIPGGIDNEPVISHDGYVRADTRGIRRLRYDYSTGGNSIEWGAVSDQLQTNIEAYSSLHMCVASQLNADAVKSCLQSLGYCEIHADLRRDQTIPVGAVLVYHKASRNLTPIAIKTGVHNYYSGINLERPALADADRSLLGVYLPSPCSQITQR